MEKVSEILNSIKERLSNPLIFSFIVSWLVYNWEITVALLWYDKAQIKACGCKSIFDFISDQLTKEGSFKYPFIIAICYTVLMPFIKSGIKLFYVWISKFTDEKEIKILDGGKIGIDKYLELREDYKKKIKDIENVAKEERKYIDENGKFLLELNEAKAILNNLSNEINRINDSTILNGKWRRELIHTNATIVDEDEDINAEVFRFSNGGCLLNNDIHETFYINDFFINTQSKRLMFTLKYKRITKPTQNGDKIIVVSLNYRDSFNYLEGKINGNEIRLVKQDV